MLRRVASRRELLQERRGETEEEEKEVESLEWTPRQEDLGEASFLTARTSEGDGYLGTYHHRTLTSDDGALTVGH